MALKDWTMSDGTVIPAGTVLGIANDAMNREEVRGLNTKNVLHIN
jgi:hypothetical protein